MPKCKECGKGFKKHPGIKHYFCCDQCNRKWHNRKWCMKKKRRFIIKCKNCGKLFQRTVKNPVYCNSRCKEKYLESKPNKPGSPRKRWLIFKRDNFICQYCGRSPQKHGIVLVLEHIKPISKGGGFSMENLKTACEDCNWGKSTDDMTEFFNNKRG